MLYPLGKQSHCDSSINVAVPNRSHAVRAAMPDVNHRGAIEWSQDFAFRPPLRGPLPFLVAAFDNPFYAPRLRYLFPNSANFYVKPPSIYKAYVTVVLIPPSLLPPVSTPMPVSAPFVPVPSFTLVVSATHVATAIPR